MKQLEYIPGKDKKRDIGLLGKNVILIGNDGHACGGASDQQNRRKWGMWDAANPAGNGVPIGFDP